MAKVCISGYYGYGRVENELMLMSMVGALRHPDEDTEIVVFSANAAQTETDHDVIALNRDQWEDIRKELRSADLLIVGGGHLLKETEDLADIKYYLKMIKTAQRMDVPVFLYHQTLEPFSSSRTRMMVAKVLQKVRKITVADASDVEILHEMGIRRGRIHVMADPILALCDVEEVWNVSEAAEADKVFPKAKAEAEAQKAMDRNASPTPEAINYDGMDLEIEIRIVEKEKVMPPMDSDHTIVIDDLSAAVIGESSEAEPMIVAEDVKPAKAVSNRPENLAAMVPSFWKKPGEKYAAFVISPKAELPITEIVAMADYIVENGYQVVFLPLCYDSDAALSQTMMGRMQHPAYIVDAKMSAPSFYTAVNAVDFVFSTELTALMVAALCKKPIASLCCSEKALEFIGALGLTPTGNLMDLKADVFVARFKAVVADVGPIVKAIEENLPSLREKAAEGEEQFAMVFEQIARKKARTAGNGGIRHEMIPSVSEKESDGVAPVVSEAETDSVVGEGDPVAVEPSENVADAPAEGYVRRSRRNENPSDGNRDGFTVALDKAKELFGGFGDKLKGMSGGKSPRQADEEITAEENAVLEAEADTTEEKEA